jgi:2-desacetyl-2-hydroxyethyl bacteriochlorophyllide A dehydrogenase
MRAIYFDKNIPKVLVTKLLRPVWPGVIWSPLSPTTVADLPEPALPGPRWLRVKNRLCGICATDLSLLLVKADPAISIAAIPGQSRFNLGHEVVSEVVEVGAGVTRFRPGDRVVMETRFFGANCFSQEIEPPCPFCARHEFGLCENASAGRGPSGVGSGWGDGYTCHETEVFKLPDDIADEQAVLMEPAAIALHAVLRRAPRNSEHVLVIGAGIIGLLTAQVVRAVAPGCHLTVVAKYPHQAEAARRCGANEVISPREGYAAAARITHSEHHTAPLNKGTLSSGFEVIYDCVASPTTIEDGLRWARAGGALVMVGIDLAPMTVDLNPVWHQEVDLIGSKGFGADEWDGRRQTTFEWVVTLIRDGRFNFAGLVTHRFALRDYKHAIAVSTAKAGEKPIKVIFDLARG